MAHIIDLKKKKEEGKQPVAGFNDEKPWRPEHEPKPELENKVIEIPGLQSKGISWSGQLYLQPDVKFVIGVSVIFFGIAVLVQIFQKNIITTVFFGLLGVVILLNSGKKTKAADFEISPMGILAYGKFYAYRDISSFWIEYNSALGIKELSLQLKKWYLPYLKIPIENQNPVQLRSVLIEFIPETEHQDTFVEILSRKLGI